MIDYEKKFAKLIEALASDKIDCLMVAHLWVIGDTTGEVAESLRRVGLSGKKLLVAEEQLIISVQVVPPGSG